MAESTLSLDYDDLRKAIGHFLGYGRTIADWSARDREDIEEALKVGLRKFYFPGTQNGRTFHEWSFLRPTATLTTVIGDADYDLPDNFGGLDGPLTYSSESDEYEIKITNEAMIRRNRAFDDTSETPFYAAINQKAHDGADGQRWELLLYPKPDAVYTISYRYRIMPDVVTSSSPFPYGGAQHAETIREACLAAAEEMHDEGRSHSDLFARQLAASIALDQQANSVETLGVMGDGEGGGRSFRRLPYARYRGVLYGS